MLNADPYLTAEWIYTQAIWTSYTHASSRYNDTIVWLISNDRSASNPTETMNGKDVGCKLDRDGGGGKGGKQQGSNPSYRHQKTSRSSSARFKISSPKTVSFWDRLMFCPVFFLTNNICQFYLFLTFSPKLRMII